MGNVITKQESDNLEGRKSLQDNCLRFSSANFLRLLGGHFFTIPASQWHSFQAAHSYQLISTNTYRVTLQDGVAILTQLTPSDLVDISQSCGVSLPPAFKALISKRKRQDPENAECGEQLVFQVINFVPSSVSLGNEEDFPDASPEHHRPSAIKGWLPWLVNKMVGGGRGSIDEAAFKDTDDAPPEDGTEDFSEEEPIPDVDEDGHSVIDESDNDEDYDGSEQDEDALPPEDSPVSVMEALPDDILTPWPTQPLGKGRQTASLGGRNTSQGHRPMGRTTMPNCASLDPVTQASVRPSVSNLLPLPPTPNNVSTKTKAATAKSYARRSNGFPVEEAPPQSHAPGSSGAVQLKQTDARKTLLKVKRKVSSEVTDNTVDEPVILSTDSPVQLAEKLNKFVEDVESGTSEQENSTAITEKKRRKGAAGQSTRRGGDGPPPEWSNFDMGGSSDDEPKTAWQRGSPVVASKRNTRGKLSSRRQRQVVDSGDDDL